ncbi:hypothetical protein EMCRGX_G011493 [Ephydatia muelleri]
MKEVSYIESDCCLRLVPSKSTHARDKANEYLPSCTSFIQYEIGPEIDSARLLTLRNKPFAAAEHTWLSYLEPEYHKCNSEKCEARTEKGFNIKSCVKSLFGTVSMEMRRNITQGHSCIWFCTGESSTRIPMLRLTIRSVQHLQGYPP